MMAGKYVLGNFRIGENVVPVIQPQLIFKVIEIDNERGLVVCRLEEMPEVEHRFKPDELEKEIVDFEISEDE
jgi:hypothetical protein